MTTPNDHTAVMRERIAVALYDNANITSVGWDEADSIDRGVAYEQADVVLDALGLEQVGWQNRSGGLFKWSPGDESWADHEPVYRLNPREAPSDD